MSSASSGLRVRQGSMQDLSNSEHGVIEVNKLLQRLDGASSAMKKCTAKQAIKEFASYYFDNLPQFDSHPEIVKVLVERLVQTSGIVSWKQMRELKMSSVRALELLGRLLDIETNQHAAEFRAALGKVSVKNFRDMKFDKHLLSGNTQPDVACLVVSLLLELRSDVTLEMICDSPAAQNVYYSWEDEQNREALDDEDDADRAEGSGYFDVKSATDVTRWNDVDVVDLHRLIEEFNDPNEDSEEQVKRNQEELGLDAEDAEGISDPLGILKIDVKTLHKGKQKSKFWAKRLRSTKKKSSDMTEADIGESIPESGSGDLVDESQISLGSCSPYEEDFNPVLFLLEVHRSTPFDQLQSGLKNLREVVNNRQNLMRELVRDHFDQFVSCKDAIDSIHDLCTTEVQLSTSGRNHQSNTGAVLPILKAVCQKVSTLYAPLFQRKDEADRIRHVLTVLKRFNILFTMPGVLSKNIKLCRYDAVVRDYRRIVNLKGINVDLLDQVISEVHKIVDGFRRDLLTSLSSPVLRFEEQIRLIGVLVDLDCQDDPALYFLDKQFEWISAEMKSLENSHNCLGSEGNANPEFIMTITGLLRSRLPLMWKLMCDIASGVVGKVQSAGGLQKSIELCNEKFRSIYSLFCSIATNALLVNGVLRSFPNVQEIVCAVLGLYEFLYNLDVSEDSIADVRNLCDLCADSFVESTLKSALAAVSNPISEELFEIDQSIRTRGIIQVPRMIQSVALDALTAIQAITKVCPHGIHDEWVALKVGPPLLEIIRVALDGIHEYLLRVPVVVDAKPPAADADTAVPEAKQLKSTEEFRTLLIVHNLAYCRNETIPLIWDNFADVIPSVSSKSLGNHLHSTLDLVSVLEQLALDSYLKHLTLDLNRTVAKGILLCGLSWEDAPPVQNVRGYVFELLMRLVFVHEQISSIGSDSRFESNILSHLALQIIAAFGDCLSQIDKFCQVGSDQLLLEIEFIEVVLQPIIAAHPEGAPRIRELKSRLCEDSYEPYGKRLELLQSAKASSSAMFECFAS